jgi:cohesin loading factor subunit SCC2
LFLHFIEQTDAVIRLKSLVALGFFLQRYGHYLVEDRIRRLYHTYLLDCRPMAGQLRCQVLINLEEYFRDCIRRMAEHDIDYLTTDGTDQGVNETTTTISTGVDLKDTTDIHSEMASSIAQCYLHIVLDTYLCHDSIIRQCVRKVVSCILEQGLVHPVQFIPYLIAMTTDRDINIQQCAEQNLQDLDRTHPGIIQTKVLQGLKMSYQLQQLLMTSLNLSSIINRHVEPIRGRK